MPPCSNILSDNDEKIHIPSLIYVIESNENIYHSLQLFHTWLGEDIRLNFSGSCGRIVQLSGRKPDTQSYEPGFESPFGTVSKIGHFRSLH